MMNADTKNEFDVSDQIVAFKKKMAPMHDVLNGRTPTCATMSVAPPAKFAPTPPPAARPFPNSLVAWTGSPTDAGVG